MNQIVCRQYKIKMTKSLESTFLDYLNASRFVYNLSKEISDYSYKAYGITLGKYDLQNQLPDLKKEAIFLKDVYSHTLQSAVARYCRSRDNFFAKRAKFPKWASKRKFKSFTFPDRVKIKENKIQLPKIGLIKVFGELPSEDTKIKQAHIIKKASGWYVSLTFETFIPQLPKSNYRIGLDLGIKHFFVTSNGFYAPNQNFLRTAEKKLKKQQRILSRKTKQSKRWEKQVKVVALLHEKVANCRKDYLHKCSKQLINENQVIFVENLKVENMIQNHKLSKSISDVGWGRFVDYLIYKSKWYGRTLTKVSPHNTSKTCFNCGKVKEDLKLSDREWDCERCKSKHDRDLNAAKNILKRGLGRSSLNVELRKNPLMGRSVETLRISRLSN